MSKKISNKGKIFYFCFATVFFVLFDKYFTSLILDNLQNFPENSLIGLTYVENTGAAFSILENYKLFLVLFAIIAMCMIAVTLIKNIKKASTFAVLWTSFLVAGIFCNMYERIIFGFVRDFIKLNFVNFPVFNISDIFINVGVFAIVIIIIKNNYSTKINENSSR